MKTTRCAGPPLVPTSTSCGREPGRGSPPNPPRPPQISYRSAKGGFFNNWTVQIALRCTAVRKGLSDTDPHWIRFKKGTVRGAVNIRIRNPDLGAKITIQKRKRKKNIMF
jgi:hypothetical protein